MMITKSSRRNFIWNTFGAGLNAFYSPLFLMIVSRVLGIRDAGFFSLAFMTGVLLSNIGLFNVRSYQITDISRDHSDSVYLNARIVSAAMMTAAVLLYSLSKADSPSYFGIVLLLGLWRVPEVLADVMHGTLQMNGRLDLAGKSLLLRAVLCIAAFTSAVYLTRNLMLACSLLVMVNILVLVLYDVRNFRMICPAHKVMFGREVRGLLRSCFPLFLISLIYAYLINAPRYAIDYCGTPEIQTVYSIIVLPASMISVVFLLVLNPILPRLAEMYFSDRHSAFTKQIAKLTGAIMLFSAAYLGIMYVIGIRVFEIVYKVPLLMYRTEFMIAGVGSGILCIATVFSNLLVIVREKKILLLSHIGVAVLAAFMSTYLVIHKGLSGAAVSYMVTMTFLMIVLAAAFLFVDLRRKEEAEAIRKPKNPPQSLL